MREGWRRAALVAISTALTLVVLEVSCRQLGVESHGLNFTRASQRWMERYWHVNELGLRDPPLDEAALARTRNLVVLGDSFAAGQGIDDPDERASGLLRRDLGPEWSVVTLAKQAWSTRDEIHALEDFSWRTQVLVLWWFVNDIESAAALHDLRIEPDVRVRPRWLEGLVAHSDFANYWYWRLRPHLSADLGSTFWDFLERAFDDPEIWAAHEAELDRLREIARERNAQLIVVVTPDLAEIARSEPLTTRALAYFARHHVPTIDLATAYRDRDPMSLVVNPRDTHPNEAVHADVAARVLDVLRSQGWVKR